MQKSGIGLIFLSISLALTGIGFDNAFAEEVKIENGRGSSQPGCELTNLCFVPAIATANVGDKIIFLNGDNAPHTSTSGTAASGPDGIWDSGLQQPGVDFVFMATNPGTYDYFCMVHPWMTGQLIISQADSDTPVDDNSELGTSIDQIESMIYGDVTPEISKKEPGAVNEVFENIV